MVFKSLQTNLRIVSGTGNDASSSDVNLLSATNNVDILSADVIDGYFAYQDADTLEVGDISASGEGTDEKLAGTAAVNRDNTGLRTDADQDQYLKVLENGLSLNARLGTIADLTTSDATLAGINNVTGSTITLEVDEEIHQTTQAGATVNNSHLIVAANLRIKTIDTATSGNVDILQLGNNVNILSADVANGSFAYRESNTLEIGDITGSTIDAAGGIDVLVADSALSGIDTTIVGGGLEQYIDVDLGDLTLNADLLAGLVTDPTNIAGAIISLETEAGIDQTDTHKIIADQLRINSGTGNDGSSSDVNILSVTNNVNILAADITDGYFAYQDANTLTIGDISASGEGTDAKLAGTASVNRDNTGIRTDADQEQYLKVAVNGLVLDARLGTIADLTTAESTLAALGAVTGSTITFDVAGSVNQTAEGGGGDSHLIVADNLRIESGLDVDILQTGNNVDILSADVAAGHFAYRDANTLEVGEVTGSTIDVSGGIDVLTAAATLSGVDTSSGNGEQFINNSTGDLSLNEIMNAGTGLISLESTAGKITQNSGGTSGNKDITSQDLRVIAGDTVSILNVGNDVDNLAAVVTNAGTSSFAYRDADGLNITTLTGTLGGGTLTTAGIDTSGAGTGGEQFINNLTADLTLNEILNAGAGLISLESTAGKITQQTTGRDITADDLRILAALDVSILNTGNNVVNLAANVSSGSFAYRDSDSLNISSLTDTIGNVVTVTGIDTSAANREQFIDNNSGNLTINELMTAGSGLISIESGGLVSQLTLGQFAAQSLRINAAADVTALNATNDVDNLAVFVTNGTLAFRDADDLRITSVTGTLGGGTLTTTGLDTGGGNKEQFIDNVSGDLTLVSSVDAGTGLVSFESGGKITQTGGSVKATDLRVIAADDVSIEQTTNNTVNLAANVTGGDFFYRDVDDIIIGDLSRVLDGGSTLTSGIQSTDAVQVRAGGNLTVTSAVIGLGNVANAVVVDANQRFFNQAGPTGLQAPNSRWLIYDDNILLENDLDGLTPELFLVFQQKFDSFPPSEVEPGGDGYLNTARPINSQQYFTATSAGDVDSSGQPTVIPTSASNYYNLVYFDPVFIDASGAATTQRIFYDSGANTGLTVSDPMRIHTTSARAFETNFSEFVSNANVTSVTLNDGSVLPEWLNWDQERQTLYGLQPKGMSESIDVIISVTNATGGVQLIKLRIVPDLVISGDGPSEVIL
ncbi:MAG: hypothetical protein GKR90_27610 [Pseudomonadales bacterium]|nr:hypothetical protein [Pseudomonadales bacterium]